jgi:hypothetical protein
MSVCKKCGHPDGNHIAGGYTETREECWCFVKRGKARYQCICKEFK